FLMTDLALACLLFASVGLVKVLFGNHLSGKKQFTGELGAVSQQSLDQLYKKEHDQSDPAGYTKEIVTVGTGVLTPIAIAQTLNHGLLKGENAGRMGRWLQKMAHFFDYNYRKYTRFLRGWPLLSDGALLVTALVLTAGELASARSKREFKELAVQRN